MRLAPLGVVTEKLRARSAEVRAAALVHARGHADSARALAAHVASMLDDVEEVAAPAAKTFRALAKGAADAVPVLVGLLQKPGASEQLVARALDALKQVGADAWAALPVLEALPPRKEVLETMAAIAPNAPKVTERLVEAVFGEIAGIARVAVRALEAGGALEPALVQLRLRAFAFPKAKRLSAHRALSILAPYRPTAVQQLVRELERGSNPTRALAHAKAALSSEITLPSPPRVELPPGENDYPEFPQEQAAAKPSHLEPAPDAPTLEQELTHGLAMVGRSATATPIVLAQALHEWFEKQQAEARPAPDDAGVQGLAAVWAHCLSKEFGWSWARYVRADERALVLASPEKGQMVFPAAWVRRQLRKKEPTVLALFSSISASAGSPPADEPSALW
jgi:hypothetical protein